MFANQMTPLLRRPATATRSVLVTACVVLLDRWDPNGPEKHVGEVLAYTPKSQRSAATTPTAAAAAGAQSGPSSPTGGDRAAEAAAPSPLAGKTSPVACPRPLRVLPEDGRVPSERRRDAI